MNTQQENQFISETEVSSVDYRQLIFRYLTNWPWFILSVLLCFIAAYLYTSYSTPIYKISARVLVNDEKKGGGLSGGDEVLGDLGGLLGGKSTVDNEVEIFKTRSLLKRVVTDLQLNITYYRQGRIRSDEIYNAPFIVKPINLIKKIKGTRAEIQILDRQRLSFKTDVLDTIIKYNSTLSIPGVGSFQVIKNPDLDEKHIAYNIKIQSIDSKVTELMNNLNVAVANKQITIIDLTLNSVIPEKGEDILNRLIFNYVRENIRDKNEVADSTIAFINRRLMIIGDELGTAEGDIQGFRQKNNLADMTEQGKLLIATSGQYINDLAKTETQISIANSLLEQLRDRSGNKRVLPSSLLPADLVFNAAIEKYNSLLLERGRKLIGLTADNPVIVNLDREIANSRADIEANLNSTLQGLIITRNEFNRQREGAEGQIKEVPATERNYLRLARQQQIKQELYVFLMQKSEETAISKTANIANSKTIDAPRGDNEPFSPKKSVVYLMSLALGLGIPFMFIYTKDFLNIKVESKDDVTKRTSVPVLGEISRDLDNDNLIIANNSRSAISEQFRALRTNLSFYLKTKDEKVILFTSSMSGEGKSFVSINLGHILALSGKKILLMELDLRKPGLSSKLDINNMIGFTNYIISDEITPADIIKPLSIHPGLFVITSGPIPPNPAETLMSPKTEVLFNQLRAEFDYIIIDAPPVGLVTDAQLLSPYADVCLYLVRQNYTLKNQINIVKDLDNSNKMKKLGIVVNDIEAAGFYGYGYGYGYGLGYGEYGKEKQKKGFLKRFSKKE